MSPGSDMLALRKPAAGSVVLSRESEADPVTPPPPETASIFPPEAVVHPTSRRKAAQDCASFTPGGNASGALASERGNKSVWGRTPNSDTGPIVLSGSWPELSESAKVSGKTSSGGPSSTVVSVNSSPMQQKSANCGTGGNNGNGIGTSANISSNIGTSSLSVTNSAVVSKEISHNQPDKPNYSNLDNRHRDSRLDQGDRQKRYGGNSHRASYGSRNYVNRGGNEWNSYLPLGIRDPHMQPGYLRPPVMQPPLPSMMPMVGPPPPFQHFYAPMAYPDFSSQMYILPTQPRPEHFRGYPFVPPPAPPAFPSLPAPVPPPVQMPTVFSLHEHTRSLVLKQIEYYFSSENLCSDFYLRSHMDNNGWVSINVIAGFKRMKLLTDDISFILDALRSSRVVEVEEYKVRRRDAWNIWILNRSNSSNKTESEKKSSKTKNQESLVSQMENFALHEENSRIGSDSRNQSRDA